MGQNHIHTRLMAWKGGGRRARYRSTRRMLPQDRRQCRTRVTTRMHRTSPYRQRQPWPLLRHDDFFSSFVVTTPSCCRDDPGNFSSTSRTFSSSSKRARAPGPQGRRNVVTTKRRTTKKFCHDEAVAMATSLARLAVTWRSPIVMMSCPEEGRRRGRCATRRVAHRILLAASYCRDDSRTSRDDSRSFRDNSRTSRDDSRTRDDSWTSFGSSEGSSGEGPGVVSLGGAAGMVTSRQRSSTARRYSMPRSLSFKTLSRLSLSPSL